MVARRRVRPANQADSARISRIRSLLPSKPMPGRSGRVTKLSCTFTPSGSRRTAGTVGVGLVAAQAQAGGDVQRHLVAAVRDAAARRPAVLLQHVQGAQVFDQAVGQGAVELQPVAVRTHAAVADQVARVLHGEQVLAGGHGLAVVAAQHRLQLEVQRRRLPRTRTGRTATAPWRRRWPCPCRSGRWRRRTGAGRARGWTARIRCGAGPRRAGRRRSSS